MAIYGKIDAAAFSNTVAVTNGDATVTKNAADTIEVGDVLELSGVAYIVKQVTSTTTIELHKNYAGSTNASLAGANAVRRTPPKAVAEFVVKGGDSRSRDLVFVDSTEVGVANNKKRGITGPGWWLYEKYTDGSGKTRHKAECLAFVHATAAAAGDDSDDQIVSDVQATVSLTLQPASQTGLTDPDTITIATAVSTSPGGAGVFQWQKQTPNGTRWTNITNGGVYSGADQSTLGLTGIDKATFDGYKFRVKVTSDLGAAEIISNTATITFA
jgi:hypothetical protein